MYEPSIRFERTKDELASKTASWNRTDKAFFASGACHILAFEFKKRFPGAEIVFIKPHSRFFPIGTHLYAKIGSKAFDFNGFFEESILLEEHRRAYTKAYPLWSCELVTIIETLDTFCEENDHRKPEDFAHDPSERASNYIDGFLSSGNALQ